MDIPLWFWPVFIIVILGWSIWAGWASENRHIDARAEKHSKIQLYISLTIIVVALYLLYVHLSISAI